MSDTALKQATQDIVVDEIFPHPPETIWRALTSGDLIARWLMPPADFAPVEGQNFTFRTTPAGAWDGTIRCRVLEVKPNERFAFVWQGGDEGNSGYGSLLDTVVTWTLAMAEEGTRVRLVHSGFLIPKNDSAFQNMGEGWKKVVHRLGAIVGENEQ